MYAAITKKITDSGLPVYAKDNEWEGYIMDTFYKEGSPYAVSVDQNASIIIIESIN